ncbi:MAG: hypothetical protein WBA10_15180 [Elainellaceae cyanobacterium]
MNFDSQSDEPPQGDHRLVNIVGTAIALLTLIVPLAAITVSSLGSDALDPESWRSPYDNLLLGD